MSWCVSRVPSPFEDLMKLRTASFLVASFVINACATTTRAPVQSPSCTARDEPTLTGQIYDDAVATLAATSGTRCRVMPFDTSVPDAEVLEVRLRTNRVVYEVAVMNREEQGRYPSRNTCYVEGVEGRQISVYFHMQNSPSAIRITTLEPSQIAVGQAHHDVSSVVLPERVAFAGQSLRSRVFCFRFMDDMAVCEHRFGTDAELD